MHCEHARQLLLQRLDEPSAGGALANPDLQAHLAGCVDCGQLRDNLDDAIAQARVWHDLTPPPWNPLAAARDLAYDRPGNVLAARLGSWFAPLASAAALVLAVTVFWQQPGAGPQSGAPGLEPSAPALEPGAAAPVSPLLAISRQERQQELAALTALLKADMERRSQETEESLKYLITHQIQSQRELAALRDRLAEVSATDAAGKPLSEQL